MHTNARVASALVLAATVAGCAPATPGAATPGAGTPPRTPATSATVPASPTPAPTVGGPTAPSPSTDAPVSLPWPAATPAQVAGLQSAVDGGAQPWLLDPTQVALAYAAARGWPDADATASGPTSVTVRTSVGVHVLTLAQPGKTGSAGIWVVTADAG